MSGNSTRQTDDELNVFCRFLAISGLPILSSSVRKCEPPAPDILCEHENDGPIAFELVELTGRDFAARLGRQRNIIDVLESIHQQLPVSERTAFDTKFGNALLYLAVKSGVTTRQVRRALSDVLTDLAALPPDFEGETIDFSSSPARQTFESVAILRGQFNGPVFDVENVGSIRDFAVEGIRKKLGKRYCSEHPIELLGYLNDAAIAPRQLYLGPSQRLLSGLSDLGPFRRVWVINLRHGIVETCHPR